MYLARKSPKPEVLSNFRPFESKLKTFLAARREREEERRDFSARGGWRMMAEEGDGGKRKRRVEGDGDTEKGSQQGEQSVLPDQQGGQAGLQNPDVGTGAEWRAMGRGAGPGTPLVNWSPPRVTTSKSQASQRAIMLLQRTQHWQGSHSVALGIQSYEQPSPSPSPNTLPKSGRFSSYLEPVLDRRNDFGIGVPKKKVRFSMDDNIDLEVLDNTDSHQVQGHGVDPRAVMASTVGNTKVMTGPGIQPTRTSPRTRKTTRQISSAVPTRLIFND